MPANAKQLAKDYFHFLNMMEEHKPTIGMKALNG